MISMISRSRFDVFGRTAQHRLDNRAGIVLYVTTRITQTQML